MNFGKKVRDKTSCHKCLFGLYYTYKHSIMKEREVIFMALPAEKGRYTFADCLTWDENDRAELIGGEIVMMAPTSRVHQKICGELFRQIANCPLPAKIDRKKVKKTE